MKGSKLFIASLVVLALSLGFFLGNFCGRCNTCCNKAETFQCERHGKMPPPGPHHHGDFHKGPHEHHGDFGKRPDGPRFKGRMNPAVIDSVLEVTPEQKAALDANRAKGDSIFRELRTQKHDAEKALGEALEKNDAAAIEAAKAKVLDADRSLLEHRINGVAALGKVLSQEQLEKFNKFRKEQMKKFREERKERRHGDTPPPPAKP